MSIKQIREYLNKQRKGAVFNKMWGTVRVFNADGHPICECTIYELIERIQAGEDI